MLNNKQYFPSANEEEETPKQLATGNVTEQTNKKRKD